MIKISDYIFQFLHEKGIDNIFMLPGGGAMHLVDSLGKSGIHYTCFLHEQAAAIASEAYGQHTNHLGVTLVTSGPGATNAITGVTAGWIDSTPMMIISGQAKRKDLIGDKGVRQVGSQEVEIIDMVRPITKYAVQILEPQKIRYILEKAYYEATTGRKGPVWLDIPLDVQAAMVDPNALEGYAIPDPEIPDIESQLAEVLKRLKTAKKPLILAGNGIYTSESADVFHRLADKLKIPVQTTWKAIDLMYEEHPLYVGHPGGLGDRGANFIIQECDLLLSLGCRLDNSITAFNEERFAPNAYKIVVDIDRCELNKFTMNIEQPVHCEVKYFLEKLLERVSACEMPLYSEWLQYSAQLRKKYPVILKEYGKKDELVSGYYFTGVLSGKLCENDIIVPESAGVTAEVTIQSFQNKKGQRLKHAAGLGSMGFGIPYAIGSCLANKRKRTILINGDGAFQLNIQELETLHRLRLPVKIFIWNNRGYASIRAMQRNNFNGHYVASEENSGLTLPDISAVARAYGFKTYKINNNKEVDGIIDKVLNEDQLVLCEVMIRPDEVVSPKVQATIGQNGDMIAGRLDVMWPFLEDGSR